MLTPWYFNLSKAVADSDHIAGAFAIVASVISMAEVVRKFRYVNLLLGVWVLISLFLFGEAWGIHAVLGGLLIALSFRKGPISELSV